MTIAHKVFGVLFGLSVCLAFVFGYAAREINLFSPTFLNYNMKWVAKEAQQGEPNITGVRQIGVGFAELNETDGLFHMNYEIITVKEVGFREIGGMYSGGDEIMVANASDYEIIDHELCHLILNRYGIYDVEIQEHMCYTIGQNYDMVNQ